MSHGLQSQSFTRRKRLKNLGLLISALLIISALIYFSSWITYAGFMTITDVSVFGADEEISDQIKQGAIEKITGSYIGMFSRSNSFLYPKSQIIKNIKSNFPRVLDVSIERDHLKLIRISVSQKVPRALICTMLPDFDQENITIGSDDPCYFADDSGYIFKKSPGFSGNPYNVYYVPSLFSQGSSTDVIGQYATSTVKFSELQSFYDASQGVGLPVNGLLMKDDGEYEIYASGTIIYFNDSEVLSTERDNLVAFWRHVITDSKSTKTKPVFDYIDLRYGSNVFYKVIK